MAKSTIRISIPSSMRPSADMVFHLKIEFDESAVLIFCRNKYSQIAVKETSFEGRKLKPSRYIKVSILGLFTYKILVLLARLAPAQSF